VLPISALRDRLRLPPDQDASLVSIRDQVIGLFESKTGARWKFEEDHVETLYPDHDRLTLLRVELRPIVELTKVEEMDLFPGATFEEQDLAGVLVIGDRQLRKLSGFWRRVVRLTYDGGWTDATCPAEVREALLLQAAFQQERHSDQKLAVSSTNFEGGSGVYLDAEMHPVFRRCCEARARRSGA